jgi:hypothetical protein
MEFHLVKGLALEEITEVFARIEGEDLEDDDGSANQADGGSDEDADSVADKRPPTPSELKSHLVKLEPSTQVRSRGANQLGRRVFSQRLKPERDDPMFIVVRNTNRWEDSGATEHYSLSVALWRDDDHQGLHAELEAQLEAVVELPVEVELEL